MLISESIEMEEKQNNGWWSNGGGFDKLVHESKLYTDWLKVAVYPTREPDSILPPIPYDQYLPRYKQHLIDSGNPNKIDLDKIDRMIALDKK